MKGSISASTAICILGTENPYPVSVLPIRELSDSIFRASAALIQDWTPIEGSSNNEILLTAQHLASNEKVARKIRQLLLCSTDRSRRFVLSEIEDILGTYGSARNVLSLLLVAPLKKAENLKILSGYANQNGFAVAASLLHETNTLQPLLNRLANLWVDISDLEFTELGKTKYEFWYQLASNGDLPDLLECPDYTSVQSFFGRLAFSQGTPSERIVIAKLGETLASSLFKRTTRPIEPLTGSNEPAHENIPTHEEEGDEFSKLSRALAEIDAIVEMLAKGDDYHAERYLDDLIERQISGSSRGFAVKSLCNIAKNCADMFRTDFEGRCIERAHNIDPTDSWTMVQFADHLKRIGRFNDAEEMVAVAMTYPDESSVAISLLADIYSRKGEFDQAIQIYKSLDDSGLTLETRTAIADNLRRQSRFAEAIAEYETLERAGLGSDRTIAGRAEVAKKLGNLNQAKELYNSILNNRKFNLSVRSRAVYEMSLADTLRQLGDLENAYVILQNVVQSNPFLMRARVLKSSVNGLLGDALAGLQGLIHDVSDYEFRGSGEWIHEYVRGLLLLRTEDYKAARKILERNAKVAVLEGSEREILRMAAAISYIATNDLDSAEHLLATDSSGSPSDYSNYLRFLLAYHVSIVKSDTEASERIFKLLSEHHQENVYLMSAFRELQKGNTETALMYEVNAMLSLAA